VWNDRSVKNAEIIIELHEVLSEMPMTAQKVGEGARGAHRGAMKKPPPFS